MRNYFVSARLVAWESLSHLGMPLTGPKESVGVLLVYSSIEEAKKAWPDSEIVQFTTTEYSLKLYKEDARGENESESSKG